MIAIHCNLEEEQKMELVKWYPIHDSFGLRNRIHRLFSDSFLPMFDSDDGLALSNWKPAVDVYDDDKSIVVKAEMPGVDKKNIDISVKDGVLTLTGERSTDNETKEKDIYYRERVYGKFQRSFRLPGEVNPDSIKADYKDGVLKVEIPKPEKSKPKQITVH
jgi:HSP20 family protein